MTTPTTTVRRGADGLRSSIAGDVFFPGDDGYDEARRAWNLAADQRPAVGRARRVRRRRGPGGAVRPLARDAHRTAGHGPRRRAAGAARGRDAAQDVAHAARGHLPGDPHRSRRGGRQWQDVTVPAGEHGLAALAGSSPNVGVTGYTLGGGIGWLARRYGLAANSVTAVEIVTPDGRLVRADADHEPDLFWAVRGGGGSVGVVTALEMRLYPVAELYAGALFFPIERSSEVLHAWREWTDTVPDEVTSVGRILRFPPAARASPSPARPRVRAGGGRLPRRRARGRRADPPAARARAGARHVRDDPRPRAPEAAHGPRPAGPRRAATARSSPTLPPARSMPCVALAGPDADTPLQSVELRHLGGALARDARAAEPSPRSTPST